MKSSRRSWKTLLSYLLAAFLLVGAAANFMYPASIAADYARWGYPDWFHFVTGALELAGATFLLIAPLRFWGATLGCVVMVGASATLIRHGEYVHAIVPLVVLAVSAIIVWLHRTRPTLASGREANELQS